MENLGRLTLDLGPAPGNPRNSEGAFIRLQDGRILFAYSRYSGDSWDDSADCCIAAVYSQDEGESWGAPRVILSADMFGVRNIMSVSCLAMANGDIGVLYGVKKSDGTIDYAISRSKDGGETFYRSSTCLTGVIPGYYVVNNDRAERLSDGRIVLPAACHRMLVGAGDERGVFDSYGSVIFFVSENDGETFYQAGARIVLDETAHSASGVQEPGIVELENGVLWIYMRTDRGCQYESFSFDGLRTCTPVRQSRFTSPCSPMKIKRGPAGDLVSVWNPIPNYNGRALTKAGWGRTPLAISRSRDDGASWSGLKLIESDDSRGYCYPALFFARDGHLLVGYCRGGEEDGACLCRLGIRKIALNEI